MKRAPAPLAALRHHVSGAIARGEAQPIIEQRAPTIHEALRAKLGREPTHKELCDDVRRILQEGAQELAARGKLPHQRRR